MQYRVSADELDALTLPNGSVVAHIFNGGAHGLGAISLVFGDVQPGDGPPLHRHAYEEAIVVHEGRGLFTIGETTVEAGPGDIIVIPAGVPHSIANIGDVPLRQTAIHATDTVAIEWIR